MTLFWKKKDGVITFIRINNADGGMDPLYAKTPNGIIRGITSKITIYF